MTADSRQWFLLALALVFFWLIYRLAPIITPFVISAALAYLGDPAVDRLERISIFRWKINRTLAVATVFVLMTVGLFLVFLIIFPLLQEQIEHLASSAP